MNTDPTSLFNALPWHDAELKEFTIDRKNPGDCDEVRLHIKWPNKEIGSVVFFDCYGLNADMNFGVICEESILSAVQDDGDPKLEELKTKWKSLDVSLDDLNCYRFETASTASIIKIFAKRFSVLTETSVN